MVMNIVNTFSDGATTSLNSATAFSSFFAWPGKMGGYIQQEVQEEGQRPENAANEGGYPEVSLSNALPSWRENSSLGFQCICI